MTFEKFTEGTGMFLMAFSELDFDDKKLHFYYRLLKDIQEEEFKKAIMAIISEKTTWYPKDNFIAIVREAVSNLTGDNSLLAWEKVIKAVQLVGQYGSPKFDDPVIHSTIELMGGWIKFCTGQEEEMKFKIRDFEKIYKTMQKRESHPDRLIGTHEISNNARGLETEEVILIGERRKVKQLEEIIK